MYARGRAACPEMTAEAETGSAPGEPVHALLCIKEITERGRGGGEQGGERTVKPRAAGTENIIRPIMEMKVANQTADK